MSRLHRIEITDTSGKTWVSDVTDEFTKDHLEQLHALFKCFDELTNLSIEIDEVPHHFNPRNITVAAIREVSS